MIKAVLFDFGGVLAEEGFREGLMAVGKEKGFDPDHFFNMLSELVYQTGYVTGSADEHAYWNAVREKTGLTGEDKKLREEVLMRLKLRPKMMEVVKKIKSSGFIVAILSDQTNWLDELNQKIYQILETVEPESCSIFIMHKENGMNCDEIAQNLFISTRTVRRRIKNVIDILYVELKKDGFLS